MRFIAHAALACCILFPASTDLLAEEEDPFCSTLQEALGSADAGHRFADITGLDAGIYRETSLRLPGAQICVANPGGYPSAEWKCLLASEAKYLLAIKAFGKTVSKVSACLGSAWTRHEPDSRSFSREAVLTSNDRTSSVHVIMTKEVEQVGSWRKYRIVVAVIAPSDAADSPGR